LRNTLSRDDRFSSHVAYSGFKAKIEFKFYPHQSFAPDCERTVEVEGGFTGFDEVECIETRLDIPLRAPNKVREEADMPLPVLVTDEKGGSREEWKKVGKAPVQVKVPHNKVMGV
jgi:hypothetical protein